MKEKRKKKFASAWIRTGDLSGRSQALYQLGYEVSNRSRVIKRLSILTNDQNCLKKKNKSLFFRMKELTMYSFYLVYMSSYVSLIFGEKN